MLDRFRYRLKPSRATSATTVVIGIGMLVWGVTTIGAKGGSFMILWVGGLVLIVLYHLANAIGLRVPGMFALEAEPADREVEPPGFAAALRDLEALRADRLVSEDEYEGKRAEFMQRRW